MSNDTRPLLTLTTTDPAPNPVDENAIHFRDRGSPSTPTTESTVAPSAMEMALSELRTTITEAEQYRKAQNQHPDHLRSHIAALQEDAEMLAEFQTTDDILRTEATQAVFEARRLKRHLERIVIDIQIQQGKTDSVKQSTSTEEKQSGLKLTPLKLPGFSGEASQFHVFRNFFEENIINNPSLTDTAKWLRLRESLSGTAAELVSELPQTAHTLRVAWKLLLDVYGGDDKPIVELYDRLQRLQPATNQTASLRLTHSKLEGILLSLQHLGHDIEENQFIKWVVLSKYPAELMYQVPQKRDTPLCTLRAAIAEVIVVRETADYQRPEVPVNEAKRRLVRPSVAAPRIGTAATSQTDTVSTSKTLPFRPRNCVFCGADHWNDSCPAYTTVATRKEKISGKCVKCLQNAHEPNKCNNVKRCYHCDSYEHNRALCPTKFPEEASKQVATLAVVESEAQKMGCFLTFMARARMQGRATEATVRVVVDTAGAATLIRRETADEIGVPCKTKNKITYTGLNGSHLAYGYQSRATVELLMDDQPVMEMQPAVVESIVQDVPAVDIEQFRAENPAFADRYIPPTGQGRPIDILLGSDVMVDLLLPEKIIPVNADTLLIPTKVGLLILGRRKEQNLKVCHTTMLTLQKNPLRLMSELEFVGLADLHQSDIEEEQAAIRQFYDTVQFVEGRYSISWPWRTTPPRLDTNYGLAMGRLKSLYKRLQATPDLLKEYDGIIREQEKQNIIEKVSSHRTTSSNLHYVPHHPVLQPEKSTKIRPVYDGAATTGIGKLSLNDNILKGTKWLNDLVATIVRFRRHETALTADITKAFHQISINEADRDAVRFIWLRDVRKPPVDDNLQIYRFKRVAFGIVASPFILHAVIQYHASKQENSALLDRILADLYADNLVTSVPNSEKPEDLYHYAKNFFGSMSMNLAKWTSNDERFRESIREDDRLPGVVQAVLGLKWNVNMDSLALKTPKFQTESCPTRRTVAKEISSFFDPLGWAVPVILVAKLFFRKIWSKTEEWDQKLDDGDKAEWAQTFQKLKQLESLKLPRRFIRGSWGTIQLHTFVDASAQAYAVVTYIRNVDGEEIDTAIVAARSRLAPKKQISIPKLELAAFVLGCKFTKFIRDSLQLREEVFTCVWSDSRCVLAWMEQKRLLPAAIHKYVGEAAACKLTQYRYVPSQSNYADIATRGATLADLEQMSWWSGPSWLKEEKSWPPAAAIDEPEIENSTLAFYTQLCSSQQTIAENEAIGVATLNIQQFTSLTKLLRMTALCTKAAFTIGRNSLRIRSLEDDRLNIAKRKWIKWDQDREYRLKGEEKAGKYFHIQNVNVFRDQEEIIRCQTRLLNAFKGVETSNPILLVKNSTLTRLIILQIHVAGCHAGTSYTLANLRREFWLPHGRRQVYTTILNHCYACRKKMAQPYPAPPPIPLPEFRVLRTNKPFQIIGMDVFGPLYVRQQPGREQPKQKMWGLIFTCAVIRAIHIEPLEDMTAQEVSYAFRRFVSRRGVPRKIVSDNAPQFHELDNCFVDLWKTVAENPTVSNYLAEKRIDWKFVTEKSPWMGGFYERLIHTVKSSLEAVYGDKVLLKRQLCTTLVEIEAVVNSRPISYVDREMETPIVTPNDFLTATYVAVPIEENNQLQESHIAKLWRSSQEYLDQFWQHWADQYLLSLRERNDKLQTTKKSGKQQPVKGDVVVMIDLTRKRSQWQTAVVERLIHSQDGEVRSVQIKLPNRVRLIRPVVALAPLRLRVDLPGIVDEQLSKKRDNIQVWPPQGASQNFEDESLIVLNAENRQRISEEKGGRSYRESEAESGGGGAVPYHPNGLENGLGSAAAEPALRGTSIVAANSSRPGNVVESHELHQLAVRERPERLQGVAGART